MFILNGKKLSEHHSFTHDGIQYPPQWLVLATEEERSSIGVTTAPDAVYPDPELFDWTENEDGSLAIISKPVGTVRGVVWGRIKAERDRKQLDGGVKVGAHWYLSTERAVTEYNTILNTTRGIPDTTVIRPDWRTMDGATIDMTPALALQILTTGIAQRCAVDDAAQAHKLAMEASADPSAYDFSTGWPKVFGEV